MTTDVRPFCILIAHFSLWLSSASKAPLNEVAFHSWDFNGPLLFVYLVGKLINVSFYFSQYTPLKSLSCHPGSGLTMTKRETCQQTYTQSFSIFPLKISEQTNFRISIIYILFHIYKQSNSNKHTGLINKHCKNKTEISPVRQRILPNIAKLRNLFPSLVDANYKLQQQQVMMVNGDLYLHTYFVHVSSEDSCETVFVYVCV